MRASIVARFVRPIALGIAVCIAMAGCDQRMRYQPKYKPLQESDFFADGRSARPLVAGTVARGDLRDDRMLFTGMDGTTLTQVLPVSLTRELLERGQERFNIYCAPCHGRLGNGDGMIVRRGMVKPPSYHEDRLLSAPIGHFYDVMTNGFGRMYPHNHIPVRDRWAIAAYIRALQLSQNATLADVPPEERAALNGATQATALSTTPHVEVAK
ncbi:MAG: cytochrome c [Candidatus Hydrogenedentota bacterium]|nr:MAG: cytochrome c [Candidatus Hydrogenedentota bacterium]